MQENRESPARPDPVSAGSPVTVERVEVMLTEIPAKFPRKDAIQPFNKQETPIVRVFASNGAVGTGYTYTLGTGGSSIISLIRDHLAPALIGQDARRLEANWLKLYRTTNATTPGAITSLAMAAIDIALWDLRCQEAGLPLHVLAGGAHQRLPLYDTEGGWLNLPIETIVANAQGAVEKRFRGFKVKVGHSAAADFKRLSAVRDVLPDEIELMTDANQVFALDEALRRARQFEDLGMAWFEEPLPADDVTGHARLAQSTSVPIAIGETIYSIGQFREYLQSGACSLVQVDVARVGGITPWLKVAHMAQAFNLAVAPHYLMELHVSLAAAVPNARWVEHIPQLDEFLHTRMTVDDEGYAVPPETPGVGIDWDWQAIEKRLIGGKIVVR
jgi:L-alanine-DL-glutamate epimerase-like enolase superfamily enzyme